MIMYDKTLMRNWAKDIIPFTPELEDLPVKDIMTRLNLTKVAKLSFNEAPQGPSPLAVKAIQEAALSPNLYPDASALELKTRLGELYKLPPAAFAVSNGADEMIVLLTQAFLNEGEEVVIPFPTFGQYFVSTRLMGAKAVKVPLTDFTIDLEKVREGITDKTKMIILCNPNNPTGTIIPGKQLTAFIRNLPAHILLVVDEAYAEYADSYDFQSIIPLTAKFPNIIAVRTFSKIYGLAACRVGYAVASPPVIQALNQVKPPFNLNVFAQAGAAAALQDQNYIADLKKYNTAAKIQLYKYLDRLNLSYVKSQANFVFFNARKDGKEVFNYLAADGIMVRTAHGWGYPAFIRLTIGSPEDMEMFYDSFRSLY
ncbi:MAG: histidinol-phosphate transaminase [Peptococcaceae bacterium]